ncbi:guanosine-5'-triphosphate,3'-diphosphate diphosphatase [Pseudoalteromonas piscicida]|uniref:Guanosine-5'-triphosphate,3'-diphosphate pyrophosphatase n=1 Tax=Pseudoalteromonas piscicida TaxID=43662 RepID=A0A2A5JKS5_PSEO7|nr:guanosine-5'-triphosphate,3'-diphosphate diphosphatase [Pseudoalteromonas piscicida]PCK30052.1 guanosine-5'-triphosphate,3'-diphosphate pyrophosphatase [Pseudoalteromonas piscicida]
MAKTASKEDIYAVIDLGSNSFHMLIAKHMTGGIQTIGRVKRKVRLASGLDDQNELSLEAMQRGWECLALFAERLQDIPKRNVSIVATATLRLAINADRFIAKAEQILGHKVNVISGEVEAKTIYKGVAHTSSCQGKQLVIDIGGASTEVVIGKGFDALLYESLNMGCVTYLDRYFSDGLLSKANFDAAENAAAKVIKPIQGDYKKLGWELAIGASGTVQAIQEIFAAMGESEQLTLSKLEEVKYKAIACNTIAALDLPGLIEERRLVFVSGLAILIALCKSLEIQAMGLAGGALREGVLYSMIPDFQAVDICQRTLDGFTQRYHVDNEQALRVYEVVSDIVAQVSHAWELDEQNCLHLAKAIASLHEIGLLIDYKQYHRHSGYILANTAMPGYSKAQKDIIVAVVKNHRADLLAKDFEKLGCHLDYAKLLCVVVRLGVLLSMRRKDDVLPKVGVTTSKIEKKSLTMQLPESWLSLHPLMLAELTQEAAYLSKFGWELKIERI